MKERSHSLLEAPVGVRARFTVTRASSLLRAPGPGRRYLPTLTHQRTSVLEVPSHMEQAAHSPDQGFLLPHIHPPRSTKGREEGESHHDPNLSDLSLGLWGRGGIYSNFHSKTSVCHTSELLSGLPNLGSALNPHGESWKLGLVLWVSMWFLPQNLHDEALILSVLV